MDLLENRNLLEETESINNSTKSSMQKKIIPDNKILYFTIET